MDETTVDAGREHPHVTELKQENKKLKHLLSEVNVVMDTASLKGVKDILEPAYQDSWAYVHTKVIQECKDN